MYVVVIERMQRLVRLMSVVVELYGYVESQQIDAEYAVGKSYNYAKIIGNKAVGGIVGGAWNTGGQILTIRYCYNTGTIQCTGVVNGGILGGTYNAIVEESTDATKNIIRSCYSIGKNESTSPNQISNKYATVSNSYYLTGRTNVSGYGTEKVEIKFKADKSDKASVYYLLEIGASGVWRINSYNNKYVSLSWQKE